MVGLSETTVFWTLIGLSGLYGVLLGWFARKGYSSIKYKVESYIIRSENRKDQEISVSESKNKEKGVNYENVAGYSDKTFDRW